MTVPYGPMSVAFAGGAAAFVHCVGMCGGLSASLAARGRRRLLPHVAWQAGRTFSYVFLGGVAGFSGWFVAGGAGFRTGQGVLAYVTGALMIAVALLQFLPAREAAAPGGGLISSLLSPFLAAPTGGGSFLLGMATGFLPCPLIWGFAALAGSTGSVLAGMSTMAALAAGTAGPLVLAAVTSGIVPVRLRKGGRVFAASILLAAGVVTLLRPTPLVHHLFGCQGPACACCAGASPR